MKIHRPFLTAMLFALLFISFNCGGNSPTEPNEENTFWRQSGIPDEEVSSLIINKAGYLVAGTRNNGMFVTVNNGKDWTRADMDTKGREILSLAASTISEIMWAGSRRYGVFYSITDNGFSWQERGLKNFTVKAIAVNAGDYVFAGCEYNGIYRSKDYGYLWLPINNGIDWIDEWSRSVSCIFIDAAGNIFAGTNQGVFQTDNNGDSWTKSNSGLPETTIFCITANSSGQLFAGTSQGVFKSADNGNNWSQSGLTNVIVAALAVNSNGNIFAGTDSSGVFLSNDNGNTWEELNNGLTNQSVHSLVIDIEDYIFAGTNNGVFRSAEPTTSN